MTDAFAGLAIEKFYAITPNSIGKEQLQSLEHWLKHGLGMVQYRAKNKSWDTMKTEALILKNLCHQYSAKLLINDSVELAMAIDADGVHLGQADLLKETRNHISLRQGLGENKIIGITCHSSLALCQQAISMGADYVSLGACFHSPTKPEAKQLDWAVLKEAFAKKIPICVIGGINFSNINELMPYNPTWFAVSSMIFNSPDV